MADAPKPDTDATIARLAARVEKLEATIRRLEKRLNRHVVGRTETFIDKRNHR